MADAHWFNVRIDFIEYLAYSHSIQFFFTVADMPGVLGQR